MTNERYTHRLTGCAPIPLAHYLKALGILRLVADQVDSTAQGWWSGDVFHLRTKLETLLRVADWRGPAQFSRAGRGIVSR